VSWRSTGILLGVALALGAGIWLSNRHETQTLEATEQAKRLFGALEPTQIEWIGLTTSDGRPVRLARREGVWRVVEPIDFPADATAADAIATALATLSSETVLEDPQPLSVYGLGDEARILRCQPVCRDRSAGGRFRLHRRNVQDVELRQNPR